MAELAEVAAGLAVLVLAAAWLTWVGGRACGPGPSRGCARASSQTRAAVPSPSAFDARPASLLRPSLRKQRRQQARSAHSAGRVITARFESSDWLLSLCCRAPSCREDRSRFAPALKDWWPEHAQTSRAPHRSSVAPAAQEDASRRGAAVPAVDDTSSATGRGRLAPDIGSRRSAVAQSVTPSTRSATPLRGRILSF